jgi:3-isopropylmalate dehydrogenase
VEVARRVLEWVGARFGHAFHFSEWPIGGRGLDASGDVLPAETLSACQHADAVLLGGVGGPKWHTHRSGVAPEEGVARLKRALGVFAELRPVRIFPELLPAVPVGRDRLARVDVLVIRPAEQKWPSAQPLSPYGQQPSRKALPARLHEGGLERLFSMAFGLAAGRWGLVTAVHGGEAFKADYLFGSSPAWSRAAAKVAQAFPAVKLEEQHVDSAQVGIVFKPSAFDVVVAPPSLGNLLLDEAALLMGPPGLFPSGHLAESGRGLYMPVLGWGGNPIGCILSAAMLLRYSLKLDAEASAVERAVGATIVEGARTADMGSLTPLGALEMGERICANLERDVGTDLARLLGHWG